MRLSDLVKIWIVLLPFFAGAQKCSSFRFVDVQDGRGIPYVNIQVTSWGGELLFQGVGNEQGEVHFNMPQRCVVAASCLGYHNFVDSLEAPQSTFFLSRDILEMETVVVTGQYQPRRVDKSIYRVKVLGRMEMLNKGVTNLTELMTTHLGVRQSKDGILGSGLSIQGLSGENVKILVDGVPVNGRMAGVINLDQLNMYNVDHIEMVEGPLSVVYGSNALAGTVNIITRDIMQSDYALSANAYFESVGRYNADFSAAKSFGQHTLMIGGGRNFFAGTGAVTNRSMEWDPKLQYNADFKYGFHTGKIKMQHTARYFNEELRDYGPLLSPYFETAFDKYYRTKRLVNTLNFSVKLSPRYIMETTMANSIYAMQKNTYKNNLVLLEKQLSADPTLHDTTAFNTWNLRSVLSRSKGRKLDFQLGYDMTLERGRGGRILNKSQRIDDVAAFLLLHWKMTDYLSWQPGLRMIYNSRYSASPVYALNMLVKPRQTFTIRLSAAKGFRSPSLKELYLNFKDANHDVQGNDNLKAEHALNLTASATCKQKIYNGAIIVNVNTFFNDIKNKIDLVVDPKSLTKAQYANISRLRTAGGQVEITWKMKNLTLKSGYGPTARSRVPKLDKMVLSHDASANIQWRLPWKDISVSGWYKYNGELPYYTYDGDAVMLNTIHAFHTMDATVAVPLGQLIFTLGVRNIFDNTSIPVSGSGSGMHSSGGGTYPVGWGRSLFFRLSFNLMRG